jgi:hypothetical protein
MRLPCGTYDPALRNSLACGIMDTVFHISRFQPLMKNGFVHRDVLQDPFERDVVETTFNVPF